MDQRSETVSGGEDVVAAVHVKDEVLGGADVEREWRRADTIETHASAVGSDRENFGAVAAVDLGGVDAVAALHQVGAVARIPDHAIVAGLTEHLVVAGAAGQRVVAVAAEQQIVAALALQNVVTRAAEQLIVARAADQRIVAGAAEQLHGRHRSVGFVDRDGVIAAGAEHLDHRSIGDRRLPAADGYGAAVDENFPGWIATGDDGVVEIVVKHGKQARARRKCCFDSHGRNPSKK